MAHLYNAQNTPEQNLEILAAHPYPGRFLVVGQAGDVVVQAYAIMGRSEGSRNRILAEQDGVVSTKVFDEEKEKGDPSLTIYDAMLQQGSVHLVSNGRQTTTAAEFMAEGKSFWQAMDEHTYEPDAPNWTPRIAGYFDVHANPDEHEAPMGLALIRRARVSDLAVRNYMTEHDPCLNPGSGVGLALHTYREDRPAGEALPPYDGPAFKLPLEDTAEAMARLVWGALNQENRVAVAAKVVTPTDQQIFIINAHHQ